MNYKILTWCIIILSFLAGVPAQAQPESKDVESILEARGEVFFRFDYPGPGVLAELSRIISIDDAGPEGVYAYANEKEFHAFASYGLAYETLTAPGLLFPVEMKSEVDIEAIDDWDFYPTYEAYLDMMYQFGTDYPELCTVFSIGQSINGRELLVARISDNVGEQEGEAQFLYTSSIHGDETTGYILTLRLIDYLLSNYGSDPDVDTLVNNLDIWINPLANPDGTYFGGNSSVYGAIRYNANGVDLNRNYPDPEDGPHPDGNEWQQETQVFMQLAEDNHFMMGANFHGGTEVCNYPWDTWPDLHADDDWWQLVCHEYADTAQHYSPSGYMSGYDDGITNGYAWYTISGGRQDYMNYFHQCREFTLEISDVKLLPASQLPDLWEYNYRSMLNYMKQALHGIGGTVTDAESGDPVYAEVFIEDHDIDSTWVYTEETTGTYHRPLHAGTYSITFSAAGYYPQTIEDVSVENGMLTTLDVQLEGGELIPDFSASQTNIPIGTAIDFTDLTFGDPVSWEWTFEGGEPSSSTAQHPQDILYLTEGTYDVTLSVSDGSNTQLVVKEDYISVSEEFIIQNTTVTTCSGMFYDSGGEGQNYGNNEDFIMTFLPGQENAMVGVEFLAFNVEFEPVDCNYDWLKIYDGPDVSAPLLGKFCGAGSPGTIIATNGEGAITFEFHSDYSVTESGWAAAIFCQYAVMPPVADFTADTTYILEGGAVNFLDLSLNEPTEWEWMFEGGDPATSEEQNPAVTYPEPGTFTVALVVTNSAGTNSLVKEDYITVDQASGVIGTALSQVLLYPNPARSQLRVSSKVPVEWIGIRSISGQRIFSADPKKKQFTVPTGSFKPGIYLVTIHAGGQVIHKKLEVAR